MKKKFLIRIGYEKDIAIIPYIYVGKATSTLNTIKVYYIGVGFLSFRLLIGYCPLNLPKIAEFFKKY